VKSATQSTRARRSHQTGLLPGILLLAIMLPSVSFAQTSIFNIQSSPSPNVQGNTLNAVAALSSTEAWAAGYMNDNNLNDSRTLTMHWDGTRWKTVLSPNPGSTPGCNNSNTGNVLNAVAEIAQNDVWAVGFAFTCTSANLRPIALHFDGTRWNVVPTPRLRSTGNAALNGILAFASNDIYAVGYQPAANGAVLTLVEHWDGTAWKLVPSPNGNSTGNVLWGVSGTSSTDIWAVGDKVAPNLPVETLVEHFDGTKWSVVPSPNPALNSDLSQNVLLSVQAASSSDVTAVGFILDAAAQVRLTLVEHWDGSSWTVIPSPNQGQSSGDFNALKSVAAISATDIYAVGFFADSATFGQQKTLVEHFDGNTWTIIPSPTKGVAQQLNGAFALPNTGNVWGVGAFSLQGTDPETGFLMVPRTLVLFTPIG
jgi:hypothetical protein